MSGIQECVLYRDFARGEILEHMTLLMDALKEKDPDIREKKDLFFSCVNGLVETAGSYGFSGNLWHTYLTLRFLKNFTILTFLFLILCSTLPAAMCCAAMRRRRTAAGCSTNVSATASAR